MSLPGRIGTVRYRKTMVTWEMPDGTEFRYLGAAVSDAALREFVLRFMSSEGMSWDVSHWDDQALEGAFLQRFGERVEITRQRLLSGTTVLVFQPVRAGA
jgi:hypothetical protein